MATTLQSVFIHRNMYTFIKNVLVYNEFINFFRNVPGNICIKSVSHTLIQPPIHKYMHRISYSIYVLITQCIN